MNNKLVRSILPAVVAAVGFVILLKSTVWGISSAGSYLRSVGGQMDTSNFLQVQESYIASYRMIGTVLLAVGTFVGLYKLK